MHFLRWFRATAPAPCERTDAMTDLRDKDHEIDTLLSTADELVGELRASLAQASAALRRSADGEDGDDNGG